MELMASFALSGMEVCFQVSSILVKASTRKSQGSRHVALMPYGMSSQVNTPRLRRYAQTSLVLHAGPTCEA